MKHISRDWMLTLREIRYGPSKKKVEPSIQCFIVLNICQLCSCTFNVTISTYSKVVSYEPINERNFSESNLFNGGKPFFYINPRHLALHFYHLGFLFFPEL